MKKALVLISLLIINSSFGANPKKHKVTFNGYFLYIEDQERFSFSHDVSPGVGTHFYFVGNKLPNIEYLSQHSKCFINEKYIKLNLLYTYRFTDQYKSRLVEIASEVFRGNDFLLKLGLSKEKEVLMMALGNQPSTFRSYQGQKVYVLKGTVNAVYFKDDKTKDCEGNEIVLKNYAYLSNNDQDSLVLLTTLINPIVRKLYVELGD